MSTSHSSASGSGTAASPGRVPDEARADAPAPRPAPARVTTSRGRGLQCDLQRLLAAVGVDADHGLRGSSVRRPVTRAPAGSSAIWSVNALRGHDRSRRAHCILCQRTASGASRWLAGGHGREPKTKRGHRRLALDPGTLAHLAAHRRRQVGRALAVGLPDAAARFVFAREDGSPYHPDFVTKHFDLLVRRVGVPRIRLHDLRHTHATFGLAAGTPAKVMADRLGHSSVMLTLDT